LTCKFTRLAVAAAALVAAAAAAAAPETPDVSQMAVRATDVPGAKVASQHPTKNDGYEASYEREFDLKTPYGRSKIMYIDSEVGLASTPAAVTKDFASVQTLLRSSKHREAFAAGLVKSFGKGVTRKDLTFGKLRTPQIGDGAIELPITLRIKKVPVYFSMFFFRIDRAFGSLTIVGARPVVAGESAKLASLVVSHIGEGLVPLPVTAPALAGTPQQGQTLTATAGTWGNTPQLSYQWQSCDAAGACVDVAGATGQSYVVGAADAGKTLRVVETATNRFGTATAQSTSTAAVAL
jgi:hypothetical protein